jgi:hypothetical protein
MAASGIFALILFTKIFPGYHQKHDLEIASSYIPTFIYQNFTYICTPQKKPMNNFPQRMF